MEISSIETYNNITTNISEINNNETMSTTVTNNDEISAYKEPGIGQNIDIIG